MANGLEGSAMCYGSAGEMTAKIEVPPPKPKVEKVEEEEEEEEIAVPAVPKAPAAPEIFPVPTTTQCIVIICVQYMIVFTLLAIVRTYHEFSNTASGTIEG